MKRLSWVHRDLKQTLQFRRGLERLYAVTSLFVLVVGIAIPPASVYAANQQSAALNPDPDKPMPQNYAGPLPQTVSSQPSAADARGTGVVSALTKASTPTIPDAPGISPTAHITPHELVDKRTATSDVRQNADGSLTTRQYASDHYYKNEGAWQPIEADLIEDTNAADSSNAVGKLLGKAESLFTQPTTYKMKANQWQARFAASDDKIGMVRLQYNGGTVTMRPNNAASVVPYLTTDANGNQTIHYDNLWPGINVEYQTINDMLREFVSLKSNDSPSTYGFAIDGADLVADPDIPGAFKIKNALDDKFEIAPLTVSLMDRGVISETVTKQTYANGNITVQVDKDWLKNLPKENFPVVIDPSIGGTFYSGDYVAYKSDGYVCYSNVCYMDVGTLNDAGNWKYWQTVFHAPYSQIRGGTLVNATMHLIQMPYTPGKYYGVYDTHNITLWHALCYGRDCYDQGQPAAWCTITTVCDIDATNVYHARMAAGDWDASMVLTGEQGTYDSVKMIDPNNSYMQFKYVPLGPTMASPVQDQVYADPQASFTLNPIGGYSQYSFTVSSGITQPYLVDGASVTAPIGTVISSGSTAATQWTVPDGILQDGSTYYVQAQAYDPDAGVWTTYGPAVRFRVDLRTGKDSTQTMDTVGPVAVDLATGNVTTSATSHSSAALGGALGVSLTYNSPLKSRPGLVGSYWNLPANYPGGLPTGTPQMTRVDQNIDFNWGNGSPSSGALQSDWYYASYDGYFVAPASGTYYFGGNNDDYLGITLGGQQLYSNGGCYSGICYGSSINLTAGQVVPLHAEYEEATGPAYAHMYVKTPNGVDQVVPQTWLQTGVRQSVQSGGLSGHYYKDNGTHDFTNSQNTLFLQRIDPTVSFNWGLGSPVAGGPTDGFMARWTGYLTVPASGTYTFGTNSDDGSRITLNGNNQILNKWQDSGMGDVWGNAVTLTAGQSVPITIDYYENGGGAAMTFEMLTNGVTQVVPASWLSPQAPVTPNGWQLGIDADGSVNYEHLNTNQNDVILTDSQGNTHDYTWTGSGYKAPVNEDGNLLLNGDGSFTLQDSDGRTYVFAPDGTLSSVTSATDDRNPAALKYVYGTTLTGSGPVAIKQITDGVDSSRWAKVYYSGDSNCGAAPTGFDAVPPANMLCAVATSDGRVTYFYYSGGQLARVSQPGSANTDFQYETVLNSAGQSIGARMVGVRSATANDAIAAGVRANDTTVTTQLSYDVLGRATSVTAPAANAGDTRQQSTVQYLPGVIGYQNGNPATGYFGATQEHVAGAPEPNGFSRRVEYDNLFRVTKDTDNSGLSSTALWDTNKDLLYSTTDPTGSLSSTIYDDEDRAVSQYGPAPASWFTTTQNATTGHTDITPQAAYASQTPHADTTYDQGITGTAVTWYGASSTTGSFNGAPVAHTTGINPTVDPTWMGRDFVTANPIPASYGVGTDYGFSATGKVRFPGSGTYSLRVWHDDGVRVWIDNKLVIDDWSQRTEGIVQDSPSGTFTAVAGKAYDFRYDYIHFGNPGALELWVAGPGITDTNNGLGTSHLSFVSPDYSMPTSTTAYDSVLGNTTSKTNYGATPELGLPQSTTVDPTGQNLTTSSAYEAQGSGFLRQTSKTLAGGNTTTYGYYGAAETRANPCVAGSPAVSQAGMMKLMTTQDPDGAGSQTGITTETVYDASGNVVATRMNSDSWNCTTYDTRGRITQYVVPSATGRSGRTVTTNYAVGGNPLISSVNDTATGTTTTQIDLLGRSVKFTDVYGNQTTITYDTLGRPASQQSLKGTETVTYDNLGRITGYALDGTTYATITYDQYNRVATVTYPQAQSNGQSLKLSQVKYDATQANMGSTYTFSDGSTYDETVARTLQTGTVTGDTITQGGKTVTSSYQYDSVGRLTSATIDNWLYQYGFGNQTSSCTSLPGYNANANKEGNRVSYTVKNNTTGVTTTTNNCYNIADQLLSSTDTQVGTPVYDAYGNITQFAGGGTPISFVYNASNQNTSITQGVNQVNYTKDPSGNVLARTEYTSGVLTGAYRMPAGVLQTCSLTDTTQCTTTDKYISLPGGVALTIPANALGGQQQGGGGGGGTTSTNLPSPWLTTKFGPATQQGSASYSSGTFTVASSGTDMWGTTDQAQLVTETLEGDGQIVARMTSQTGTDPTAKAGLIVKNTLTSLAKYQSVMVTPGNGIRMEGNYNTTTGSASYTLPNAWLKLVRTGNTVTTYNSADGVTWTQVGTASYAFLKTVQIGMFVLSHNASQTNTATFDNVTVAPATASTLPAGWTNGDTGNPATPAGTSAYANGVFTLTGREDDVWDTEDQAQRAYQTVTGDCTIVARVTAQNNSDAWGKAGVFIKASPADMSNYVSVHRTPGHGTNMEWNYNDGDQVSGLTPPNAWYKLVRVGNTFTGYKSSNGTTWTQVGTNTDSAMPATVMIGLLVVSGDNSRTATATFDNVTITSSGGQQQQQQTPPPPPASPAVYSIQNFHGDTAITVNANGLPTSGVYLYDPFGGNVVSATFGTSGNPSNATDRGMGWATSPTRKQEAKFTLAVMQMGARVYVPSLGRFTQRDPVDGGTPNPYVYVLDPIQFADYSGQMWGWVSKTVNWAKKSVKAIIIAAVVVTLVVIAVAAAVEGNEARISQISSVVSQATATVTRGANTAKNLVTGLGQKINGAFTNYLKPTPVATEAENEVSPAYKSSLQTGQAAHNEFNGIVRNAGGTPNSRLGSTLLRPDGQFDNGDVWELKPGNLRGVSNGLKQLQGYMDISGGKGQLWLYNQNMDGSFNFWQYQP